MLLASLWLQPEIAEKNLDEMPDYPSSFAHDFIANDSSSQERHLL